MAGVERREVAGDTVDQIPTQGMVRRWRW
jgi:hypothetical protein